MARHRGKQGFESNESAFQNCNDHVSFLACGHSHRLTCISSRLDYLEMLCMIGPNVEIRCKKGPGIAVRTVN